jgi:hypothetical protein
MKAENIPVIVPECIFWFVLFFFLVLANVVPADSFWVRSSMKVFFGAVAGFWLYIDSFKYNKVSKDLAQTLLCMCMIFVEIIAPVYIFYSRGFKKGLLSIAIFLAKFALIGVLVALVLLGLGVDL